MAAGRIDDTLFRTFRIPRVTSRKRLIVTAVLVQAFVLGMGWWAGFRLVRGSFEQEVNELIQRENAELLEDIAKLFPADLPEMLAPGTDEWDKLQGIVENLNNLPGDGFACLVNDSDGSLVCHPDLRDDQGLYGQSLGFEIESGSGTHTLLDAPDDSIVSGRARVNLVETHYVATKRLGESGYRLLVHQKPEDRFALQAETMRTVRLIALGSFVLVMGLSGLAVRVVVRQYDSVFEQTNRHLTEGLELARQIQESTLPQTMPAIEGLDIAGWSESAEETGGDTFDVIAHRGGPGRGIVASENPECVTLLLADATGHGVGPAISVTEMRAMLRMALRGGMRLYDAVRHLNEQLHDDLPMGRFITAWIAEIDPVRSRRSIPIPGRLA